MLDALPTAFLFILAARDLIHSAAEEPAEPAEPTSEVEPEGHNPAA